MKLTLLINSILLLTLSSAAIADQTKDDDRCKLLNLDVANATNQIAFLVGDPESERLHGYIFRRGHINIPASHSTTWVFHDNPFAGPEGTVIYRWLDKNNQPQHCKIHYRQSYCGLTRAGSNTTEIEGNCSNYNDKTKPSKYWNLSGESQITLGVR